MIEAAIVVILLTAVSLFIQEVAKIPLPMSLVGFVLVGKAFGLDFIHVDDAMFDQNARQTPSFRAGKDSAIGVSR